MTEQKGKTQQLTETTSVQKSKGTRISFSMRIMRKSPLSSGEIGTRTVPVGEILAAVPKRVTRTVSLPAYHIMVEWRRMKHLSDQDQDRWERREEGSHTGSSESRLK